MRFFPHLKLSQLVHRDANNLDLVRLSCAGMVIYGHASLIVSDPTFPNGLPDIGTWLRFPGTYSASIAVKIFFFISGLLVTNSLLTQRSITRFIIARILRVWPALVAVLSVTAFIIGPIFSILDPREYFSRSSVYYYVVGNILMMAPDHLPGVFLDNHIPKLVNGALWSLSYEIAAYLAILVLGLCGILRNKVVCALLLLMMMADLLLLHSFLWRWLPANPQIAYLPFCFAFGAFLALTKDKITLSAAGILTLWLVFAFLVRTPVGPMLWFISLFLTLLYVSGLPIVLGLRLPADLSYGTFLWGFVIQQMLASRWPARGLLFHLTVSLSVALCLAFLSWHLIEKPALRLAKRWTARTNRVAVTTESGAASLRPWTL